MLAHEPRQQQNYAYQHAQSRNAAAAAAAPLPVLPAPTKLARQTLKPSDRRHALCASINSAHLSSPSDTTHSSRGLFVSGHEQQIFLPDLPSTGFFFSGSGISCFVAARQD